ncbi:MAG: selenium-binding protein SBP56-related protein, partial [Chloroflexota bacterium]|nr:selenium-binding protein SBP56-related protein [Chloroflexota bacterium]
LDTPGEARDVILSGKYLYVADWGTGVVVMDVSNPLSPRQVGSIQTEGKAQALYLDGDRLYVTEYRGQDAPDAVTMLSLADAAHPRRLGEYSYQDVDYGNATLKDVTVQEGFMYALTSSISRGGTYLLVVDVHDPASPRLVTRYERPSVDWTDWTQLDSLAVVGNYAYIGAYPFPVRVLTATPPPRTQGVLVLDISDPKAIKEVGRVESLVPERMVLAAGRLYATDGAHVAMFDVSEPSQPQLIDLWDETNNISSLQVAGGFVYLTRGYDSSYPSQLAGLMVLGEPSN